VKVRKSYHINQSPLYQLRSKKRLSELLGIPLSALIKLSKSDSNYKKFSIKKNGKARAVEAPKPFLSVIHRKLFGFLRRLVVPDYLHSGVKKRSHVTNATAHTGENELAKIDIKAFYPSTKRENIYQFFRCSLLCSPDVSKLLTEFCTVDYHIPTGSQISQVLAFHCNRELFDEISQLSITKNITFTCYVDDLSFSGSKVPPSFLWEIKKVIVKYGYRYHKEHRYPKSKVKVVTGVAIRGGNVLVKNAHHQSIHGLQEKLRNDTITERELKSLVGMLNSASQLDSRYGKLSKVVGKQRISPPNKAN